MTSGLTVDSKIYQKYKQQRKKNRFNWTVSTIKSFLPQRILSKK